MDANLVMDGSAASPRELLLECLRRLKFASNRWRWVPRYSEGDRGRMVRLARDIRIDTLDDDRDRLGTTEIRSLLRSMRPHIIALSRDTSEVKRNLDLFDRLAPLPRSTAAGDAVYDVDDLAVAIESISAFVEKLTAVKTRGPLEATQLPGISGSAEQSTHEPMDAKPAADDAGQDSPPDCPAVGDKTESSLTLQLHGRQPVADPSATEATALKEVPAIIDTKHEPAPQAPPLPTSTGKADKGNLELLRNKDFVTVQTARRFGGVKPRAIQAAITKGRLDAVGNRPNRRISVASLLKYFPPENSAR